MLLFQYFSLLCLVITVKSKFYLVETADKQVHQRLTPATRYVKPIPQKGKLGSDYSLAAVPAGPRKGTAPNKGNASDYGLIQDIFNGLAQVGEMAKPLVKAVDTAFESFAETYLEQQSKKGASTDKNNLAISATKRSANNREISTTEDSLRMSQSTTETTTSRSASTSTRNLQSTPKSSNSITRETPDDDTTESTTEMTTYEIFTNEPSRVSARSTSTSTMSTRDNRDDTTSTSTMSTRDNRDDTTKKSTTASTTKSTKLTTNDNISTRENADSSESSTNEISTREESTKRSSMTTSRKQSSTGSSSEDTTPTSKDETVSGGFAGMDTESTLDSIDGPGTPTLNPRPSSGSTSTDDGSAATMPPMTSSGTAWAASRGTTTSSDVDEPMSQTTAKSARAPTTGRNPSDDVTDSPMTTTDANDDNDKVTTKLPTSNSDLSNDNDDIRNDPVRRITTKRGARRAAQIVLTTSPDEDVGFMPTTSFSPPLSFKDDSVDSSSKPAKLEQTSGQSRASRDSSTTNKMKKTTMATTQKD